jgi:hypothetical protein
MRDWGMPVLYNRAPDGRVFHAVSDGDGQAKAEEYLEDVVRQEFGVLTETSVTVGTIDAESALVEQRVREQSRGILIGGIFHPESEGVKKIVQEIEQASGITLGSYHGDPERLRDVMGVLDSLRLGGTAGTARREPGPGEGNRTSSPADQEPAQPPPSEESTCPRCGKPIKPDYRVCAFCGLSLPR